MTATALPLWIWLAFTIVSIGVITFIYTQGNWRVTLNFILAASLIALSISGIGILDSYIRSHFIGQYDELGIPFKEAGPGPQIFIAAWPLWLVPTGIVAVIVAFVSWLVTRFLSLDEYRPSNSIESSLLPLGRPPITSVATQLEITALHHELNHLQEKLTAATKMAEEQIDKNLDLEIKIKKMENHVVEENLTLQDKIIALELEVTAKSAQNEELTTLTLQQAEEIAKLKEPNS